MSLSKCPAPCILHDGMSAAMFQVNNNLATGQLDVPILLVFDVQSCVMDASGRYVDQCSWWFRWCYQAHARRRRQNLNQLTWRDPDIESRVQN